MEDLATNNEKNSEGIRGEECKYIEVLPIKKQSWILRIS